MLERRHKISCLIVTAGVELPALKRHEASLKPLQPLKKEMSNINNLQLTEMCECSHVFKKSLFSLAFRPLLCTDCFLAITCTCSRIYNTCSLQIRVFVVVNCSFTLKYALLVVPTHFPPVWDVLLCHSFGIQHDGNGNDCEPIGKRPFVMSPQLLYGTSLPRWSRCSRQYITRFLE